MGASTPARAGVAIPALVFAAVLAAFILVPPFLKAPFDAYPSLRWGDAVDLFTPLVVIPLAWVLLRTTADGQPAGSTALLFLLCAALWVEGQGMHLAANAIANFRGDGDDALGELILFLDETLSHYLWHAALLGLSAVIGLRSALRGRAEAMTGGALAVIVLAAALYGFTFFAMVVEGGTGALGLPGAVLFGAIGLWLVRARPGVQPAAATFAIGYALAVVLFVIWAGLNDWRLVQFSEAGLL